jgi:hypothetical protein
VIRLGRRITARVRWGGPLAARLAVLIGDVRRGGVYYPLAHEVMRLNGRIGTLQSVIIKAQHNCSSDAKSYGRMEDVPIRHEYCLIFEA